MKLNIEIERGWITRIEFWFKSWRARRKGERTFSSWWRAIQTWTLSMDCQKTKAAKDMPKYVATFTILDPFLLSSLLRFSFRRNNFLFFSTALLRLEGKANCETVSSGLNFRWGPFKRGISYSTHAFQVLHLKFQKS